MIAKRRLGRTGIEVTSICLGKMTLSERDTRRARDAVLDRQPVFARRGALR